MFAPPLSSAAFFCPALRLSVFSCGFNHCFVSFRGFFKDLIETAKARSRARSYSSSRAARRFRACSRPSGIVARPPAISGGARAYPAFGSRARLRFVAPPVLLLRLFLSYVAFCCIFFTMPVLLNLLFSTTSVRVMKGSKPVSGLRPSAHFT